MPNLTSNYSLNKPLVNNATDQDLWGGYLNDNMDTIDTQMLLNRDFKKRVISAADSVVASDRHKILLCDATTAAFTLDMIAAATAADGFILTIVKTDATSNAVTIDGNAAELIGPAATFDLTGQGDAATLVCDGANWNFAGNKTTPSGVASASTTAEGIIEIATDAEFQTGTDTSRAITAANVKAGLGFSKHYESSEQTVPALTNVTLTHGLGSIPKLMIVELVCKTTDQNYAVGDRIIASSFVGSGSTQGFAITYNATQIIVTGESTMQYLNKTTGQIVSLTNSSWKFVARAWA